jgi:SAM-dependent methyltransferase
MIKRDYVFDHTNDQKELSRLRAIESVFDPPTKNRLNSTGLGKGWQCLELGPGAGSIMNWLGERVGTEGQVTAVEINPRFLREGSAPNISILEGDIRNVDFREEQFNLIHGRYVLFHIVDYQSVLKKLLGLLKPGGWLVLEEPDFSVAHPLCGEKEACLSVKRINRAIHHLFTGLNLDPGMGRKLLAGLQSIGVKDFRVDNDVPIARGGSGIAKMMRMSAEQLREKYISTKEASAEDVERYCKFAEDRNTWAIYYSTIAIMVRNI